MEVFKNPKHIGEIKNPSGVGKVGNPVCLLPDQNIHINNNLIKINEISKEKSVLSHDGQYNGVSKSSKRNYNGKILTLKNKLGKISITPDHLIFAVKVPGGDKFLRTTNKKNLIPAWYHADQLKVGDITLYPPLKRSEDMQHIKINIPKSKWDFKSREIPKKIPLNSDLLRLFGYFLSEGNIQNKPSKTFISFTLNFMEKEIVEDIQKISKSLFGPDIKIKEIPERKTTSVFLYNAQLARFFKGLFGNGAKNKKIPDFIMNLPTEKQKSIIFGLWRGDGYINLNRNGPRAGYVTISYQLVHQIKLLLLRQKITPSIYEEEEKRINGVNHQKSYRIHIGQRDSLKRLCGILNTNYSPKSYESVKSWFDDGYLYTPITGKEVYDYTGVVHNLEVNNSHSFTSEAFCLHNCGDVMWVYLRIEKKNSKEFIKDIKIKTFGCVAAITTSSIMADLVKGKSLKEAEKLTQQGIIAALGGLPSIKKHCSDLALKALKKAIEDYKAK